MPDLPTVSVVVPTYRRRDLLEQTLAPLLDSGALEIIVVVDGVDDGSMEMVASLSQRCPGLRCLWRENGGEGAARQTGLEAACGDIVLFLDDDVLARPSLVQGHAKAHAGREALVVLGYMPTQTPWPRRPGQFATFLYSREYEAACRGYENGSMNVLTQLWAGNMSLRRSDALRVGMVGADFRGVYHADQDLGLRCASAGLTGDFDRRLAAEHVHVRPLDAFVRDARGQGAGKIRLAAVHPDHMSAPDDDQFLTGLPKPLQSVVTTDRGLDAACRVLRGAVSRAGALRLYRLETAAAKALRRFEQVRGARQEREP